MFFRLLNWNTCNVSQKPNDLGRLHVQAGLCTGFPAPQWVIIYVPVFFFVCRVPGSENITLPTGTGCRHIMYTCDFLHLSYRLSYRLHLCKRVILAPPLHQICLSDVRASRGQVLVMPELFQETKYVIKVCEMTQAGPQAHVRVLQQAAMTEQWTVTSGKLFVPATFMELRHLRCKHSTPPTQVPDFSNRCTVRLAVLIKFHFESRHSTRCKFS